jgi:Kef-type K+ transport system membrane component KefB
MLRKGVDLMIFDLNFIHASPFYELTALLLLAALIGVAGLLLRQPMVVSYIAVGILAGPSGFGIVKSEDSIEQLSELSVAVLLFLVGMKLDLNKIRTLGWVSLVTGLGQILFTSIFGFLILQAMGFGVVSSLYISIALTFSSTIIIVKLLSDKQEVDSLHGRIAIGFLIVQDLAVVAMMMMLSAFGEAAHEATSTDVAVKLVSAVPYVFVIALLMTLFMRYVASPLIYRIIRSSELLIIFAISWAALFAAAGTFFGFSKELGGLLAGISLASTSFRESIVSKLSTIRDFLLLFFFVSLGGQMNLQHLETQVMPAIVLSLFVLIGNPLIVMIIMGYMGYRKRTGLLAGLTVAQISEFSLILIAMGLSLGHVSSEALSLVTLVGLITIATSIYMITYAHVIYRFLDPILWVFERKTPYREEAIDRDKIAKKSYDVILFGLGRYGMALGNYLKREHFTCLGIDYDPDAVRKLRKLGFNAVYGDVWDYDLISKLPLNEARWVILATPLHDVGIVRVDSRQTLIQNLKREKFEGKIAVSAQKLEDVKMLREQGADLVFLPFHDAAERAVERIVEMESVQNGKRGSSKF